MRRFTKVVLLTGFLLGAFVALKGFVLATPSGTWQPTGNLSAARPGASAALLQNGSVLITGGDAGSGPVASADLFNSDGSVSPLAAPMNNPRSNHVSATLQDGRVLVAGGTVSGGGATNSAEIFDPVSGTWSSIAGGMVEARSGAAAALLQDGRVLIAGGESSGVASATLEIFDPLAGTFSAAGVMSSPRTKHAMAMLADGRVIIIGGSNGTAPVASTDILNPVAGSVAAGPSLATPRSGHSATTLLDGRVLVAGGNNIVTNPDGSTTTVDLASAEIFDPAAGTFTTSASALATARTGHLAFLLPHNNNVLIVGGTLNGVSISSAELFTPWQGTFSATGSLSTARSNAAGSPMQQDGLLLVAGGKDAATPPNALASTEVYGFATVKTDKSDYAPGTTVTITGSGWKPGETVTLTLVESPLIDTHGPYTVTVQPDGTFSDSSFTTDIHDISVKFTLTAVGSASQAQTIFWDNKGLTVQFAGTGSGSVSGNDNTTSTNGVITCADSSGNASGTCTFQTGNNDTITLTETPTSPSTFGGWSVAGNATITSGTCTSSSSTCKFSMNNDNITVTATFNPGAASKYIVTSSNSSPVAGTAVTITAQLADSGGNPVHTSGKVINWNSTNGGSFSPSTSTTNANGVATTSFTASTMAGTVHTVTATDNTSVTGTSGSITTVAGAPTTGNSNISGTSPVAATGECT